MTIFSSKLINGSQGTTADKNAKTYSETYLVRASLDETQYSILSAFADIGAAYPVDAKARLNNKSATQKNQSGIERYWNVELSYASSQEQDIAPWLKPYTISYDEEDTEKEITRDRNGKLIANTAFDLFLDRQLIADSFPTFTITKNYQSYNYILEGKLKKTLNKKPFLGFPKETLQKQKTSAQNVTDDKWGTYVTVVRTFKYNPDWRLSLDNVGLRYLATVEIDGEPTPRLFDILANGQPITTPVALDENGQVAPVGEGKKPIVLNFEVFNTYDFNKWYQ